MSDVPSEPDTNWLQDQGSEPDSNWLADPKADLLHRSEWSVNYGGGPILITRTRLGQPHLELTHNGKRCGSLVELSKGRWRLLLGEPCGNGFVAKSLRWLHGDEDAALAGAAPWVVLASRGNL